MKINTVVRTKLGVQSCPSLRIAENQGQGKDKKRIFCPRLLKLSSFSISFFLIFLFLIFYFFIISIFLNFFFSIFLIFPFLFFLDFPFLFFWIFLFYFFGFSFFIFFYFFFTWTYSLLPVKLISIFSSGLTLYRQSNSFSSFHLDLFSIASQILIFLWTYL